MTTNNRERSARARRLRKKTHGRKVRERKNRMREHKERLEEKTTKFEIERTKKEELHEEEVKELRKELTESQNRAKMLRYVNNCLKITSSRIADPTYYAIRDDEVDFGSERVIEDTM